MGALVSTDVSLSLSRERLGRLTRSYGTAVFGGAALTYPFGGVPLPAIGKFGFSKEIEDIKVLDDTSGFTWRYNKDDHTLKAFVSAPPIVFEEVIDCDADVAYTKYPAAYIMYVASANAAHKVVSGLLTPATGQVAVKLYASTPGQRAKLTFPSGEGAASTYVTYVTQAWKEVFDNLVEDETLAVANFTAGTPDKFNLANMACAIQNVTWNDAGTVKACTPLVAAADPATTEVAVDFVNTTYTTLGVREEDAWDVTIASGADTIYVTYIKKPTAGFLYSRFTDQEDLTPSTDVITLATNAVDNALIFGTMGGIAGGATTKGAQIVRSGATLGTTATILKLSAGMQLANTGVVVANTFTAGSDHSDSDHLYPTYIYGIPEEIFPLIPLEIPNGETILSNTLRFEAWGK
uniref:Tail protein n=1 Tax=viral metagenome TaxID=1070528 RepID=A0A6M3IFG3_9ZZZZ